jgi:hypothetical protein
LSFGRHFQQLPRKAHQRHLGVSPYNHRLFVAGEVVINVDLGRTNESTRSRSPF